MAAALAVFAAGKHYYAVEEIGKPSGLSPEERRRQMKQLGPLFGIFGLIIFFWIAYEHNDNLWVFFARDHLDLNLPDWLGGGKVAPDQFQFINAALILGLVPFSQWFWPKVDPTGRRFPSTTKMLIGFLFTASAPAVMATAASLAEGGTKVSMFWIVLAYFLLTVGEVLVYGTGLDLSYAYAPANMKGFITACFLLTNSLANLINSRFAPLYGERLSPAHFFVVDTVIVLVAAVAFYFVGKQFNTSQDRAAAA
jgi:POT family proton-dependent oligopeptide transporter